MASIAPLLRRRPPLTALAARSASVWGVTVGPIAAPPPPAACCPRRSLFQATHPRLHKPSPPPPVKSRTRRRAAAAAAASAAAAAAAASSNGSSSSSSSSSSSQPLSSLLAQRRLPLIGAALAAGVLGFYIMPLLYTYLTGGCRDPGHDHDHDQPPPAADAVPTGLPPVSAAEFDVGLDFPERIMGITFLRRQLAAQTVGHVLEVAVGTGRNIFYYPWGDGTGRAGQLDEAALASNPFIASFTGVDLSTDALSVARRRLRNSVPGAHTLISNRPLPAADVAATNNAPLPASFVDIRDGRIRLLRGDAMQPLPQPAPSAATDVYDTVVQTFGLCSVADPVALVAHMAAVVRPDSGRILLLEHGRGERPLVNSLLDRYAPRHFSRFGCWWNRDINGILAKAQAAIPGLEVVSVRRPGWFQFGTLWWVELRVNSSPTPKSP